MPTLPPSTEAAERFDIRHLSGEVAFSAEITCAPDALPSLKMGLAVRIAVQILRAQSRRTRKRPAETPTTSAPN